MPNMPSIIRMRYSIVVEDDIETEHYREWLEEIDKPFTVENVIEAEKELCKEDFGYMIDTISGFMEEPKITVEPA